MGFLLPQFSLLKLACQMSISQNRVQCLGALNSCGYAQVYANRWDAVDGAEGNGQCPCKAIFYHV